MVAGLEGGAQVDLSTLQIIKHSDIVITRWSLTASNNKESQNNDDSISHLPRYFNHHELFIEMQDCRHFSVWCMERVNHLSRILQTFLLCHSDSFPFFVNHCHQQDMVTQPSGTYSAEAISDTMIVLCQWSLQISWNTPQLLLLLPDEAALLEYLSKQWMLTIVIICCQVSAALNLGSNMLC